MEHNEFNEIKATFRNIYKGVIDDRKRKRVLTKIKETGDLEKYIEESNVSNDFEILLNGFIHSMDKPKNQNYPNYIRFVLNAFSDLPKCFAKFNYEFGAYFCDHKELTDEDFINFTRFDWFFKNACKKYDIEPYASMEEKELYKLLNDYLYLQQRKLANPCFKHPDDMPELNKKAIQMTYERFNKRKTSLVSNFGDGFGYSILYRDKEKVKEYLIEVKASYKNSFKLSRNEHKMMYESADLPNTEYLIYKYNFTKDERTNEDVVEFLNIYKFDKKRNVLVDIYDEKHICLINPSMDFERDNGRQRVKFLCEHKYLGKNKTLNMIRQEYRKKRNTN